MLTDTTLKRLNTLGTLSKQGKKINGLFRLLESEALWKQAYSNLYADKGSIIRAANNNTKDGCSVYSISRILKELKAEKYVFNPVRRIYIPKKNSNKCSLGIKTGDDKLVQEVCRMILNCIYEPIFSNFSHGFREDLSCHSAMDQIRSTWAGTKWIIKMEIKDFDNLHHDLLISCLEKKIDDKRFIKTIERMLLAGFLENNLKMGIFDGTMKAGNVYPILSNIYLNELDNFIETLQEQFNKGKSRAITQDWKYRKLLYNRYTNELVLGIIGSKKDATEIASKVQHFINTVLKWNITNNKYFIVHASKGVRYLDFDIHTYSKGTLIRAINEKMQISIPQKVLYDFCKNRGYGIYETRYIMCRSSLIPKSDAEIIQIYNAELRGFVNYYSIAVNAKRDLQKIVDMGRASCAMTLAAKYNIKYTQMIRSMKTPDGEWVRRILRNDRTYDYRIYRLKTDFTSNQNKWCQITKDNDMSTEECYLLNLKKEMEEKKT